MRFLDLFCGAGGLSTGLVQAGWECVAGVDWDDDALATFAEAHKHSLSIKLDLISGERKTTVTPIIGQYLGDIDAVVGGPPCPDFSIAGKGAGENGERNGFPAFLSVVRLVRPRVVLFENVPNLQDGHGDYFGTILADLKAMGYGLSVWRLNAADYGVPQKRIRVFVVGLLNGASDIQPPTTTHSKCPSPMFDTRAKWVGWETVIDWAIPCDKPLTKVVRKHVERWLAKRGSTTEAVVRCAGGHMDEIPAIGSGEPSGSITVNQPTMLVRVAGSQSTFENVTDAGKIGPAVTVSNGDPRIVLVDQGSQGSAHAAGDVSPSVTCGGCNEGTIGGARPHVLVSDQENAEPCESGNPSFTVRTPAGGGGSSRNVLVSGKNGSEVFGSELSPSGDPALTCTPYQDDKTLVSLDDLRQRYLTVRELAALQDYPIDYPFHGCTTSKRRQIGNSCCRSVLKAIGKRIDEVVK